MSKLNKQSFKAFLQKYTKKCIPSSTFMVSKYLPRVYEDCLQKVRDTIGSDSIYCTTDETTDSGSTSLGALVIGSLDRPKLGPYLINLHEMDGCDNESISKFFEASLEQMYPEGNHFYFIHSRQ